MKIDNLTGVKPVDSLFDGFFRGIHSVAAVFDRRICQGYGEQAADVTNKKTGANSDVTVFAVANACCLANLFAQLEHPQNWDLRASAYRFW